MKANKGVTPPRAMKIQLTIVIESGGLFMAMNRGYGKQATNCQDNPPSPKKAVGGLAACETA
jgi:hypothetical protein